MIKRKALQMRPQQVWHDIDHFQLNGITCSVKHWPNFVAWHQQWCHLSGTLHNMNPPNPKSEAPLIITPAFMLSHWHHHQIPRPHPTSLCLVGNVVWCLTVNFVNTDGFWQAIWQRVLREWTSPPITQY